MNGHVSSRRLKHIGTYSAPSCKLQAAVTASPLHAKYATAVDRDSAHEMLARKVEEGAEKAAQEAPPAPAPSGGSGGDKVSYPKQSRTRAPKKEKSVVTEVLQSSAAKQFMRTAAREIARGLFKTGRR